MQVQPSAYGSAAYLHGGAAKTLTLDLPAGAYWVSWIDPVLGSETKPERFTHGGGPYTRDCPRYSEDLAMRVIRAAD